MKKLLSLKARLQNALRRSWSRSWERAEALRAARISRGVYRCAKCKALFGRKEINVDHRSPVGAFVSWDQYIDKLFCPVGNLQVLCSEKCHKAKTKREAQARAKAKKSKLLE